MYIEVAKHHYEKEIYVLWVLWKMSPYKPHFKGSRRYKWIYRFISIKADKKIKSKSIMLLCIYAYHNKCKWSKKLNLFPVSSRTCIHFLEIMIHNDFFFRDYAIVTKNWCLLDATLPYLIGHFCTKCNIENYRKRF